MDCLEILILVKPSAIKKRTTGLQIIFYSWKDIYVLLRYHLWSEKTNCGRTLHKNIKVTVYPQIDNFDPNEISNVKKKSWKKIKYWQRNGGLKFWPEVKFTCLIDILAQFSRINFFT